MRFISVRDLRIRPGEVWRKLEKDRDLVLTSNGKPIAVITDVGEEDLEQTLNAIRSARALAAIRRMHRIAKEKGLDKLTADQVNEKVTAYRASRVKRGSRR